VSSTDIFVADKTPLLGDEDGKGMIFASCRRSFFICC
jgi:hypothetical protein